MPVRLLILLSIIFAACQSGRIPCPEPSMVKIRQSNPNRHFVSSPVLPANGETEEKEAQNTHAKNSRKSDSRTVKNITVEEWDCPRPGAKKYLPRSVKENIRKNTQRLKEEGIEATANDATSSEEGNR